MNQLRGSLKSVTMWFNGILGAAVVALPTLMESFPAMEGYLSHKAYHAMMGAIIVGNILLRVKTSASLAEKGAVR
jgi:cytochrome b561